MNFTFTASMCAAALFGGMLLLFEVGRRIGTRWLKIDPDGIAKGSGPVEAAIFGLLPPDVQPEMRLLFRRYVDSRLETYRNVADANATRARLSQSAMLQSQIWTRAVAACQRPEGSADAGRLLLPALNQMFDITTTRAVARQNHPPRVIFFLLAGLSPVCSALVGYVMCGNIVRSWFYMLLVATTMSLTLYVILELEFPRLGAIRIDAADQTLVELRNAM
jgi:hypothetical protein